LKTEQINSPGYQNYADRYDVNGGTDLGYRVTPDIAATLGYRYGHQGQQQYSWDSSLLSSPSDYQRVLAGIEGKPFKWLKVELQAGPDFRSYAENTATHITPVTDKNPVKYYGEASLTAEIDPKDTVAFKYKQFQWVSSTGRIPYFDSQYDLTYKRKLTGQLGLDLGAKLSMSDYTSGNVASSLRDDWQYTLNATLRYAVNPHLSFDLAYAVDLGRNAQDELPAAQQPDDKREFTRHIVSLGANFKF
jgi:opacity protein-like surface antigen